MLQQYIDKINKQNNLRLNKKDLKEAQILDEYLQKNKKEKCDKKHSKEKAITEQNRIIKDNFNDFQSYRSGQTSSTYKSID